MQALVVGSSFSVHAPRTYPPGPQMELLPTYRSPKKVHVNWYMLTYVSTLASVQIILPLHFVIS